jgi:hypothetical protein
MTTVDQFLKALAVVESSDNPEAWGDTGHAMGRWQVHPDRLVFEAKRLQIWPKNGETYDQWVASIVREIWETEDAHYASSQIAMYWHKQVWTDADNSAWDLKYAARFDAALMNAQEEIP